jgi:hypothetical protein
MTTMSIPTGNQIDLSRRYGCAATMTVAYFVYAGIVHVARRLWRQDLSGTGKIELYTVSPDRVHADSISSFSEDWLGYVDEFNPSRAHLAAMEAVAAVAGSTYTVHSLAASQAARYAQIELT